MPEQRMTKDMVLDAALDLVRERGEGPLSARAVAERAGCSVQPLYSLFGDMNGLVDELYEHARAWAAAFHRRHRGLGSNPFESNGLSHLLLARTERNLFAFLYLSPHMDADGFEEVYASVALEDVERCIQDMGGLSPEAARKLYLHMIVYTHGMAVMLATGARFDDDELAERLNAAFHCFLAALR